MASIEKTVFISYRRTDVYTALAVYENLKNQGYDVFFDYRSISSGDFEQIITGNIRARAHFLVILTPTALDRCNDAGDWLRREIEIAIDEKRNIVPLFFKGFRFGTSSMSGQLTGKLKNLSRYNGLNVHEDYFDEAMQRLRTQYLNTPLNTVLHPVSMAVQRLVREEQFAADKALDQIENVQQLVKEVDNKTNWRTRLPSGPILDSPNVTKSLPSRVSFNSRLVSGIAGVLLVLSILSWGASKLLKNLPLPSEPTATSQTIMTLTSQPSPTQTSGVPTQSLGIGSTTTSEKDGMVLVYVPAGEFTMGSEDGEDDEKPVHTVYLDTFWIDQTEVTNKMYALCVDAGICQQPDDKQSYSRSSYYGNREFDNYPVIHVNHTMAKTFCEWAGRRLPTEAEWEKAARGDDARTYPWGNEAPNDTLLNYDKVIGDTTEVGRYPNGASPYGALDMAGNVSEWVADIYSDTYYAGSPGSNPLGFAIGLDYVMRGGDFFDRDSSVRSSGRLMWVVTFAEDFVGFRCAESANEKEPGD